MRVSNEREGSKGPTGAFAELFRLQSEFQSRLAEETLRYLRRMHGAVVPSAPGTVVVPAPGLQMRAAGAPGGRAELVLEIENLQRVHCMVTPQLSPLVSAAGVTWFPAAESATSSKLVAPGEMEKLAVTLPIPTELAAGEYRGALMLQGFRRNAVSVTVVVGGATPTSPKAPAERSKRSARPKSSGRKSKRGARRKS